MTWKMEKGCRHMVAGLVPSCRVIDPSDNWSMHRILSIVYVNVGKLSLVLQCRKNNHSPPLPPSLHLTPPDTAETRQLGGDYWLGANATAVLNIYACEYRHFGISGGLLQARDVRRQSKSEKTGHNFMQHLSSDAEISSKNSCMCCLEIKKSKNARVMPK